MHKDLVRRANVDAFIHVMAIEFFSIQLFASQASLYGFVYSRHDQDKDIFYVLFAVSLLPAENATEAKGRNMDRYKKKSKKNSDRFLTRQQRYKLRTLYMNGDWLVCTLQKSKHFIRHSAVEMCLRLSETS